jgi:hypothetical protein
MGISSGLSLCTSIALLAIWAIVFWYVAGWIGMSERATLIVRVLIVAVAVMMSLQDIVGSGGVQSSGGGSTMHYTQPNIIAPERR